MMKRLPLLSFIIMAVLSQWVNAQNQDARKSIVEKTNVKALVEFGEKSQKEYVANKKKALDLAKKNNWVVKSELPNGVFIELQGVSPDGRPIYYATDNKMAAQTVSTDKAWSNGDLFVDIKEGTQWHTNYFALEGQQQSSDSTDFYQASLDLKEFGGQDSIVIRFRAEVGSFFYSDIAIDKIEVGTDMYAPMLTQLNVVEVSNTWAQLKLKANDDGEACLLISNDTASTPTVDEILTGKKITLTKNVEQLVTFEDLENNTCYKVSVITVDSVNNISEIYSIGFTTLLDGVQFDQSKNILIYPNPNQGLFYLNLSALNYRQASYTLFDALGRLVEQQKVNQQQTTIEINNRQKGLYYLQLLIDNQIYVKKIMAE